MDENPPIRRLTLKRRDVEPVDKVARPGDGTAISVRLMHLENNLAAERGVGSPPFDPPPSESPDAAGIPSVFRPKDITPMDPPAGAGDPAITIADMLEKNRAAAHQSEPELIAMPPRRRSRRHRDFIVLVSLAAVCFGTLSVVFKRDMQLVGLALFGIVFLTVILAWIMYGVMDRY